MRRPVGGAPTAVAVIDPALELLHRQLSGQAGAPVDPLLIVGAARRPLPPLAREDDYWLDHYTSMGPGAIPPAYVSGRWARPRPPVADVVAGGGEED